MGVLIPFAVIQAFHQARGRVADHQGNRGVRLLLDGLFSLRNRHLHGVGLGGQGHINDGLRQVDAAFRNADEVAGLVGGDAYLHGPGIRQAHILRGEAEHAPGNVERIFAAFEHAHHPVHRGVRVGIPHGLMQGRDQVVMLLAILVIHQAFAAQALGHDLVGHLNPVLADLAVEHHHFQRAQGAAGVPVAEVRDGPQGLLADGNGIPAEAALIRQGPVQQGQDILPGQGLEHKNLAPGQESAVDLKGRVFRRGADEHDAPFFHKGQEGILLRLVEAVDFIHEYDGADPVGAVLFRFDHDLADFLDAAGDGGKVDEICSGLQGDHPGQRRLADPRGPPENHGGDQILGNQPAQYFPRAQQMLLAGDLVQRGRPHPGRQGLTGRGWVLPGQQGDFTHGQFLLLQSLPFIIPQKMPLIHWLSIIRGTFCCAARGCEFFHSPFFLQPAIRVRHIPVFP